VIALLAGLALLAGCDEAAVAMRRASHICAEAATCVVLPREQLEQFLAAADRAIREAELRAELAATESAQLRAQVEGCRR
jgi:hypothetical protein